MIMKTILTILIAATLMVSCKKEDRNETCMEMYINGELQYDLSDDGRCSWLTDENNNLIVDAYGTPTPNN